MTLPLRKKLQTILSSTLQVTTEVKPASRVERIVATFRIGAAAALVAVTLTSSVQAFDTPLERLSRRSALERWQEVRDKWIPQRKSRKERREERKASSSHPHLGQQSIPPEGASLVDPHESTRQNIKPPAPTSVQKPTIRELLEPRSTIPAPQPLSIPEFSTSTDVTESAVPVTEILVPDPYKLQEIIADREPEPTNVQEILVDVPTPESAVQVAQIGNPKNLTRVAPVLRPISEIEPFHDYSAVDEVPRNELLSDMEFAALPESGTLERNFGQTHYHWVASNLRHNPLYFEDVSLERYGHSYPYGVQPFVSLTKFGVQVAGLPYQMALNPAFCDHYALGYYRPGDCAPKLCYRIPWNKRAVATAAGVYTGLIFLFP